MNGSISDVNNKCFGCTACVSICPANAIIMIRNSKGFMYPYVDDKVCVNCGKCRSICPAVDIWDKDNKDNNTDIYAFINEDENILEQSTSGGFFSEVVKRYGANSVVGCVQDKDLTIRHVVIDDYKNLDMMRGSKYVQSDMSNSYSMVKKRLDNGDKVVFSGTSCQIHGLVNYLNLSRTNTNNLLTIDFICHGVPSPGLYQDYIKEYELKTNRKVLHHVFRCKKFGWGSRYGTANYIQEIFSEDNDDFKSLDANIWQNIFFSDLCLRDCCYECPYTSINKPADFTMGDFWGVEKIKNIKDDCKKGCSVVFSRSTKSKALSSKMSFVKLSKSDCFEIVSIQSRLNKPVRKPELRDKFWSDYEKYGFSYIKKKYFRYSNMNKILLQLYFLFMNLKIERIVRKIEVRLFY